MAGRRSNLIAADVRQGIASAADRGGLAKTVKTDYASGVLTEIRQRLVEALLARRIDRWVTGTTAVLLVALGFLAGRWTSLTSNATPIVFQDLPGAAPVSNEDLVKLATSEQESGSQKSETGAKKPEVRGQTSQRSPTSDIRLPTSEAPLGAFVASANGKKYYHPSCKEVRRIKEENLIWFDSEEEARESGYEPSKCVTRQ